MSGKSYAWLPLEQAINLLEACSCVKVVVEHDHIAPVIKRENLGNDLLPFLELHHYSEFSDYTLMFRAKANTLVYTKGTIMFLVDVQGKTHHLQLLHPVSLNA